MQDTGITQLIQLVSQGDKDAERKLLPLIYSELHRIASAQLRRERPDHTLQPTALIHEVYLRLTQVKNASWKDRAHFFSTASQAMRRILVDYARRHSAAKRGGPQVKIELDDSFAITEDQSLLVLQIDQALERLEQLNARQAKVVELRFFAGLSEEEIGECLGVSARTVKRDWTMARAWLYGELSG